MKVLSTFSGVSAASVAWKPLGYEFVGYAEVNPFASAVLALRCGASRPRYLPDAKEFAPKKYQFAGGNNAINFGDVTQITDEDLEMLGDVDVLEGGSPCFPAGHLVTTTRGLVPIEEVVVGDMVLTHKKRYRAVLRTGGKVARTITAKGYGHAGIVTTEEHPFYVRTKSKDGISDPFWLEAAKLTGHHWSMITEFPELEIPQIVLEGQQKNTAAIDENLMWLAGAYLGDGYPLPKNKAITWGVNDDKADEITYRLEAANLAFGVLALPDQTRVTTHGIALTKWMTENFGKGCDGKTIPAWLLGAPREMREAFYDGYFAMDGNLNRKNRRFSSVTRAVAYGIRMLANSLGYGMTMHLEERNKTIVIKGKTVRNAKSIYRLIATSESKASFELDGMRHGLVRSVTVGGEELEVFNLEVEEDNSYCVDGLVVHNCQAFSLAGARGGFSDARGNLTLAFVQLALRMRKINNLRFVVWENVKGVINHADNPLGHFLAAFAGDETPLLPPRDGWSHAGHVVSPDASVAWRIFDAQFFEGTPQRRERVYAVVSFDPDVDPGEVLFVEDSEGWSYQAHREAWKDYARCGEEGSGIVAGIIGRDSKVSFSAGDSAAFTLLASDYKSQQVVVHALQNSGNLGNQEATGIAEEGEPMYTILAQTKHGIVHPKVVGTLMACGAGTGHVASAGNELDYVIVAEPDFVARRLMPVETERLQGFPDSWTDIEFDGEQAADGHRYRVMGNSMAVPCVAWIGRQLKQAVERAGK